MPTNNDSITIDITINAPVKSVWNAWTNPDLISHWFGSDPNGTVLKAELNVQTGQSFKITFRDSDGTGHTCSGIYVIVEELSKLAFTWT